MSKMGNYWSFFKSAVIFFKKYFHQMDQNNFSYCHWRI